MGEDRRHDEQTRGDEAVVVERRQKVKRPERWRVLLHNDDYTTMDFVIQVLEHYFQKSRTEATHIMLHVHHNGSGVAGVYPRDVAETKASQATQEARALGMPLLLTVEPE